MLRRWSSRLLGLCTLALASACSSESVTEPDALTPAFDMHSISLVYVCKAGLDDETIGQPFTFTTEATGGDVVGASTTLSASPPSEVSSDNLGNSDVCKLVWTGPDPSNDVEVAVSEAAADGSELASVRVWDIFGFFGGTGFTDVVPDDGSVTVVPGHGLVLVFNNGKRPPGGEGCTPGYWKQPHHYDSWVGYDPMDLFSDVFGVGPDIELGDALEAKGGGENALVRHAVAALLNAASPDVDYGLSEADIVDLVQEAFDSGEFEGTKDQFDDLNNRGCGLS